MARMVKVKLKIERTSTFRKYGPLMMILILWQKLIERVNIIIRVLCASNVKRRDTCLGNVRTRKVVAGTMLIHKTGHLSKIMMALTFGTQGMMSLKILKTIKIESPIKIIKFRNLEVKGHKEAAMAKEELFHRRKF